MPRAAIRGAIMPRLNRHKLDFRRDLTKSVGPFLAYCALARALRRAYRLHRQGPVIVGILLPEDTETSFYETAVKHLAYKHARKDALGRRDTLVLVAEKDGRGNRYNSVDFIEAMRDFQRIVVLGENRGAFPQDFDLVADHVVEVGPVLPRHVQAAAKLCLHRTASEDDAAVIASKPLATVNLALRPGRSVVASIKAMERREAERKQDEQQDGPKLEDLHGLGDAGAWGRELATDFADWQAGRIPWSDVDRGILVSGPPGTGKTTFAKALAATCGVHLVLGSMGRWQAKGHLGDMLKAMRAAFDEARKKAPSIVFLDEIDAAGDRERFDDHNREYDMKVVAALLECIDGAEGREGVVVVGACNHPHRLDAALVRPGRLDRHVRIPFPDAKAREGIVRFHLRGELEGADLSAVSERTEGRTGADLEQLVRSARRSARRLRRPMEAVDLENALPARSTVPEAVVRRSAVHEAGHVLVGLSVGFQLKGVTLADTYDPNGSEWQAGGGALFGMEHITERTRQELLDRICVALAGLAAEEAVFGTRGAGGGGHPGSDLYVATLDALQMEASYGLGGGLAYLSSDRPEDLLATLRINGEVRKRVDGVLNEQFRRARGILQEQRGDLERLAADLYAKRELSLEEVRAVVEAQPRLALH